MSNLLPTLNFGGLASGLDTNTIVSQLMAIEARPRVRLEQRERVELARQTALRDVETRLRNLKTAISGLRDVSTWGDVQTASSSDATKVGVRRVGGAAAGGYAIQVDALARAAQTTQGSALTTATSDDTLRIQVGTGTAVDVAVVGGDSIDEIAEKINGTSGTPVYASVVSGKLVLSGKTTGASETISVTDGVVGNGYDLASDLGLAQTQAPQNADFWVDGVHYTNRSSNTVTDVLTGIELTLKTTTSGATVGVSIGAPGPDSEAIVQKVQAFIEQYNSTIEFVRAKLNEKVVPNATTDADRAKGVLRGDAGLQILLSRLRSSLMDGVTGLPSGLDQLSEVGLTTGATTGSSSIDPDAVAGKLSLDASLLREKLASSFGDVKLLFNNPTGVDATEGIAQRLEGQLDPWLTGDGSTASIISGRISAAQSAIDSLRDRQTEIDQRLALRERSLRAQFTAMETALQAAQSQGQWLAGQLANLR